MLSLVLLILSFAIFTPLNEEASGYHFDRGHVATTIKFNSYKNLIIIPAQLNDTIKLNLILDTGTRSLILFGKKVKKLKNIVKGKIKINGRGNSESLDASLSFPNNIKIGDVAGKGIGAVILNESELMDAIPGIDGIIGYELFIRFCIKIDYAKRTITLYDEIPADAFENFHTIELSLVDSRPEIISTIHTSKKKKVFAKTLIDTGSSMGLLVFANKKNNFNVLGLEKEIGTGLAGSVTGFYLGISSWQLGDIKFFPKDCNLVPTDRESESTISASIGGDFLKDHVVMFHYPSSQFFIKAKER
ncbi:MAG: aspartyl protease family protein [Cyclobacteriaceae bacterium]